MKIHDKNLDAALWQQKFYEEGKIHAQSRCYSAAGTASGFCLNFLPFQII